MMTRKKETYKSEDGKLELRLSTDGSQAELRVVEGADLIGTGALEKLIADHEVTYGFENAVRYCQEAGIKRQSGEFFPIARADDITFEPEVEILLEPLDCLMSQSLYSLSDLTRVRHITAGEKLAKVKTGSSPVESKNIFGNKIRDLAQDKSFQETYLGANVEFDTRRNLIIASGDGYGLVENSKKISIIDNILLQQDIIEAGYEVKTSLTLDGSIFSSELVIGGDLLVRGKIEGCRGKGIIVTGSLTVESAEDSLIMCKKDLTFRERLVNCQVYCNGSVKGGESSRIIGGNIQSGLAISAGRIGGEDTETIAEVSIAPFVKGMMIQLSQELRKNDWDPGNPDKEDPLVKELEQLEIRYSKIIPDFLSENRELNKIISENGFSGGSHLRIFNLSWNIENDVEERQFALIQE
jgi:hypothetical protein